MATSRQDDEREKENEVMQKKIGIRYCGGCNPRYNRGALVKRITEKYRELSIEVAKEGKAYDLLLVVGGCSSCCASYKQFQPTQILKIWTDQEALLKDCLNNLS